jgi:hypothetical protein
MPQILETVLKHVEEISNNVYRQLIQKSYKYLVSSDTSTNYQKDNVKLTYVKLTYIFAKFLGAEKEFDINRF